jgi:hypothetical protein
VTPFAGSDNTDPSFNRQAYVRFDSLKGVQDLGRWRNLRTSIEGFVGSESGSNTRFIRFEASADPELRLVLEPIASWTDKWLQLGVIGPAGTYLPLGPDGRVAGGDIVNTEIDESAPALTAGEYVIVISNSQWQKLPFRLRIELEVAGKLAGVLEGLGLLKPLETGLDLVGPVYLGGNAPGGIKGRGELDGPGGELDLNVSDPVYLGGSSPAPLVGAGELGGPEAGGGLEVVEGGGGGGGEFTPDEKIYAATTARFVFLGQTPETSELGAGLAADNVWLEPAGVLSLPDDAGWMVMSSGKFAVNNDNSSPFIGVAIFSKYTYAGELIAHYRFTGGTQDQFGYAVTKKNSNRFLYSFLSPSGGFTYRALEVLSILADGSSPVNYTYSVDLAYPYPSAIRLEPRDAEADDDEIIYILCNNQLVILDSSFNFTSCTHYDYQTTLPGWSNAIRFSSLSKTAGINPTIWMVSDLVGGGSPSGLLLVKTDADGVVIWAKRYFSVGDDRRFYSGDTELDAGSGTLLINWAVTSSWAGGNTDLSGVFRVNADTGALLDSVVLAVPYSAGTGSGPGELGGLYTYGMARGDDGSIYLTGEEYASINYYSTIPLIKLTSDLDVVDAISLTPQFDELQGYTYGLGGVECGSSSLIVAGYGNYGQSFGGENFLPEDTSLFFTPLSEAFNVARGWYGQTGSYQQREVDRSGVFEVTTAPAFDVEDVTDKMVTSAVPLVRSTGAYTSSVIAISQVDYVKLSPPIVSAPDYDGTPPSYDQSSVYDNSGYNPGAPFLPADDASMGNNIIDETQHTVTDASVFQEWIELDLGAVRTLDSITFGADLNETLDGGGWGPDYARYSPVLFSQDGTDYYYAGRIGNFTDGDFEVLNANLQARFVRVHPGFVYDYVALTEFKVS